MRRIITTRDEILIKTEIGELRIKGTDNPTNPTVECHGIFDEPQPINLPRHVTQYLQRQGYDLIVTLGRAVFTPTILAANDDTVIACDYEERGVQLEKFDTIRVPLHKVDTTRLACLPLEYYFSRSKTGAVFVTTHDTILNAALDGHITHHNGTKYVEVPRTEWTLIGARKDHQPKDETAPAKTQTNGGHQTPDLIRELNDRLEELEQRLKRLERLVEKAIEEKQRKKKRKRDSIFSTIF